VNLYHKCIIKFLLNANLLYHNENTDKLYKFANEIHIIKQKLGIIIIGHQ